MILESKYRQQTEHYKQYERFKDIIDINLGYSKNMNFNIVCQLYVSHCLKYNTGTQHEGKISTKVFDFLEIPNDLTYKERLAYYQLLHTNKE